MKTVRVLIDSREKEPLPFPATLPTSLSGVRKKTLALETSRRTLKTGDYMLDLPGPLHDRSCVERKCGAREVHSCFLGSARTRVCGAGGQLDRLALFTSPLLLIEAPYTSLLKTTEHNPDGPYLLEAVFHACNLRGIAVHCLPNQHRGARRRTGEWVVRYLLAIHHRAE